MSSFELLMTPRLCWLWRINFQCLTFFVPCAFDKNAHLCCPCTSARNICPTTGCILQYKCNLGDIWGWLQGSLLGYEAERSTSCLKQVLEAHSGVSVSETAKVFLMQERKGGDNVYSIWSDLLNQLVSLQKWKTFVDTDHIGCKSRAVGLIGKSEMACMVVSQ